MSIGSNIRELRTRYGLTQQQLGEIAGVSDKAVSTWESGQKEPRMGAIQKLSDYFNIPKSYIIDDHDHNAPTPLLLSPDELALLQNYRKLSPEGQHYIRQTMDMAVKNYDDK
jgi:transcriptional regulator with XRE-family HTH domain